MPANRRDIGAASSRLALKRTQCNWRSHRRSAGISATPGSSTGITGVLRSTACWTKLRTSSACHRPSPWGPITISAARTRGMIAWMTS